MKIASLYALLCVVAAGGRTDTPLTTARKCSHPECRDGTVVIVPHGYAETNETYQEACPRCDGTGVEPEAPAEGSTALLGA